MDIKKISFRKKILLLIIVCMCVVQATTMVFTLFTTEMAVRDSIHTDLVVGESVFDQLFNQRFSYLYESANSLLDDKDFKQAIENRDNELLKSALSAHASNLHLPLSIFIDTNGEITSSLNTASNWYSDPNWMSLFREIKDRDNVYSVFAIEKTDYQIITTPVNGAVNTGWLLMGLIIDDKIAREFKSLTRLEITILNNNSMDQHIASTLSYTDRLSLLKTLGTTGLSNTSYSTNVLELYNDTYLSKIKPINYSSNQFFVILKKSLSKELFPYYEMKTQLIKIFIGALAIALLLGIYIGGNMVNPILKLAEIAKRIGKGNYDVEIPAHSMDEIGQLSESLNIMQQEIAEREDLIYQQTHYDELTGLPNRFLSKCRIEEAIQSADKKNSTFCIIMLDLMRFKQINDSLGHHVGDIVLKETATRLTQRLRKSDTAAHMGGDDFLIIMKNTNVENASQIIKNEINQNITTPITYEDIQISMGFNYGIVEYPRHADTVDTLLRRCEIALYEAKDNYQHTSVYEIDSDKDHVRQLVIVSDIDEAIKEQHLTLNYQPKVCFSTGNILQAEALVRWQHPKFGFMPPDEFIAVLEQTGNINKLSHWLIEQTTQQCKVWQEKGLDVCISINLSTQDLLNPELVDILSEQTNKHALNTDRLLLEITESAIMQDPILAIKTLSLLREAGYRVSIDDFGTGYSSLGQLKKLPVNELKIDKSFILNLKPDSDDAVIVKSTIDLAHSMGLKVVAEGIESQGSIDLLKSYGCDTGQGYFFSKPLPVNEFENWCKNNSDKFSNLNHEAA